ncbi:MAG: TRAP transporter substrate-binding protein [Chloroflexi bacterium]|nr:TRAP transporter substrate-binding protein [Chloroflexota bacterium]
MVTAGMLLVLLLAVMPFASACAPAPAAEEAPEEEPEAAPEAAATLPKAEYQWRLGTPWTQDVRNQSLAMFCELIGDYSDGRIEVEFYPDGLLGSHTEIFHAVQEGTVEIGIFAPYVDIVPGGMMNWIPWTVGSFAEAAILYTPPDGAVYKVANEAWNEVGGQLLWSSPMGLYGIGSNVRPLKTPDDLKDQKMRVSASVASVMAFENMGEGTGLTLHTIPWADLYNALERGVVDMCWSLWGSLVEERHMEVLKYYTAMDWAWDCANVSMNKELWDSLPSDLKDAIFTAGKMAEERDFEAQRRQTISHKQKVLDAGVEIYYPTTEERNLWREKANMGQVWEELCKPWLDEHYPGQNMTQELQDELDRVRALAEAAGAV